MSVVANNIIAGASGQGGSYKISKSLRFNSGDSADLRKTFSSAGNTRTFTISFWVKRSKLGAYQRIFATYPPQEYIRFENNDTLRVFESFATLTTNQVFRDPSSFYHIVISADSTQATASDRLKLYVNGTQVTQFSTATYPSQNATCHFFTAVPHQIGSGTVEYFNGLLAEVYMIDGQQLLPSQFGEFDDNNVWQPKEYSGTYGTNGFNLKFDDTSSNAALGTDSSGNSNTWTVNNMVAASKNYASYVYAGGSTYSATETGKAFYTGDGDDLFDGGTSTYVGGGNVVGGTLYFRPATAITGVTSIELYGAYNDETRVNGSVVTVSPSWSTSDQYVSVQSPPSTITEISVKGNTGFSAAARLKAIKVNGSMLVDSPAKDVDSLVDTPTNYEASSGNNGGNYATLNPLSIRANNGTMENGNLTLKSSGSYYIEGKSTIDVFSFNNYCELTISGGSSATDGGFGIGDLDAWVIAGGGSYITYRENGAIISYPGNTTVATVASWTVGDVLGMAVDTTNVKFYKNGTLQGTYAHGKSGTFFVHVMNLASNSNAVMDINFGQRPFSYAIPSGGYKSLCTTNLPEPVIADGSAYFDTVLYTGDGNTTQTVSLPFSPGLTWQKKRSGASSHYLHDVIRGFSNTKALESNTTNAEGANSAYYSLSQSGSNLTLGDVSIGNEWNINGQTHVIWTWNAGSSTVSNTDGSITSSVRANPAAGFSIVSYTGNNTNSTVGHGLNAAPSMVIVKNRDQSYQWTVYHDSLAADKCLFLNSNSAQSGAGPQFNNSKTTSTTFPIGAGGNTNYPSGSDVIAYCFSPVSEFSSAGKYIGNGSTDGPFVFTSMRPRLILLKPSSSAGNWSIYDTARSEVNVAPERLYPNTSSAEESGAANMIDILSNGFKLRHSNAQTNGNGITYIYMAFAENPFSLNGGLAR